MHRGNTAPKLDVSVSVFIYVSILSDGKLGQTSTMSGYPRASYPGGGGGAPPGQQGGYPGGQQGGYPGGQGGYPGGPQVDPQVQQWFNAVDQDRSGQIDHKELQVCVAVSYCLS